MTRFIMADALHVSQTSPDPESRVETPFGLEHRPGRSFHLLLLFKKPVFICVFPKTALASPQRFLFVTQLPLLPISAPPLSPPPPSLSLPRSTAPPRGRPLLLTGVICASGIDVVCRPIKIFEGNVYFLERIVPAARKPF